MRDTCSTRGASREAAGAATRAAAASATRTARTAFSARDARGRSSADLATAGWHNALEEIIASLPNACLPLPSAAAAAVAQHLVRSYSYGADMLRLISAACGGRLALPLAAGGAAPRDMGMWVRAHVGGVEIAAVSTREADAAGDVDALWVRRRDGKAGTGQMLGGTGEGFLNAPPSPDASPARRAAIFPEFKNRSVEAISLCVTQVLGQAGTAQLENGLRVAGAGIVGASEGSPLHVWSPWADWAGGDAPEATLLEDGTSQSLKTFEKNTGSLRSKVSSKGKGESKAVEESYGFKAAEESYGFKAVEESYGFKAVGQGEKGEERG